MKSAYQEATSLSEFSKFPGLCVYCWNLDFVRDLAGGRPSDGVCQACDQSFYSALFPTRRWVSWGNQKSRLAAEATGRNRFVRAA
jgi:hypothetical protein